MQQQSAGAASFRPTPRRFAELGVSSDPADISLERVGELIGASLEERWIVEKNEIEPPQRLRYGAIVHPRHTIGANRLFSDAAYSTSLSASRDATAAGDSTKMIVSDRPIRD
jgi:hypothetical protein